VASLERVDIVLVRGGDPRLQDHRKSVRVRLAIASQVRCSAPDSTRPSMCISGAGKPAARKIWLSLRPKRTSIWRYSNAARMRAVDPRRTQRGRLNVRAQSRNLGLGHRLPAAICRGSEDFRAHTRHAADTDTSSIGDCPPLRCSQRFSFARERGMRAAALTGVPAPWL
jgi:hypothetical protein